MASSFPKIGEIANPGREVTIDMEYMAISLDRLILPCPVFIFITDLLSNNVFTTIIDKSVTHE